MLAFLYHEGSWTRGIFRRPAGARAVRELRDSLDGGEFQLPLMRDHVFIIAGVFKVWQRVCFCFCVVFVHMHHCVNYLTDPHL